MFEKTIRLLVISLLIFSATLAFAATDEISAEFDHPYGPQQWGDYSFYQGPGDTKAYPLVKHNNVKNVILCIGDGMGISQTFLAEARALGVDARLYLEKMPITGIVKTHSANELTTDSAAAGTAMATGFKTNNKMIGMSTDGKKFLTIFQAAQKDKMRTGLVATSTITHATPASFASHMPSRKMQDKIAEHLLANKVNVLIGGGRGYFIPKTEKGSKRSDSRDLLGEAKDAGYFIANTPELLQAAKGDHVLSLLQSDALTTKEPEPSLAQLTQKAIELLNGKGKGFFLMVEGSQIDWKCHANDANNVVRQTLLFDLAIKAALDFALKDGHTLVIVTADHETGGLMIKDGDLKTKDLAVSWTAKGHSATPVILYAFGPGAENFTGLYDNTEIPKKIATLLKIKSFPEIMK